MKQAVVLLSGGVDSTTTLAIAVHQGYLIHALTFDYGQRHRIEIEYAKHIAEHFKVKRHLIVCLGPLGISGSALTDNSIAVPKHRDPQILNSIPPTYVPARNTIFLSYALSLAESIPTGDIFIGVNAVDFSGYPDCRPQYIQAFERLANLATKAGVEGTCYFKIHAPLISMKKSEIILKGLELGVDYSLTHSCYDPESDGLACGGCDSCLLRKKGFKEAGITDPATYRT
jgi:7-cyano-7-deazaguanine synthase